jgi:hypothetical protein
MDFSNTFFTKIGTSFAATKTNFGKNQVND